MSFILDALKKSESDRQRQSGPALFEVKVAPPKARFPVWAIAIAALLVVNMIIVGWMLLRHSPHNEATAAANDQPGAPAGGQGGLTRPGSYGGPGATGSTTAQSGSAGPASTTAQSGGAGPASTTAQPGSAGPASALAQSGDAGPASTAAKPADRRVAESDQHEPTLAANGRDPAPGRGATSTDTNANTDANGNINPEPAANPDDYAPATEPGASLFKGHVRRGTDSGLMLYQDAAVAPGANLPQLRLDLHVYAAKPQDRFALINMHKMHEGDSLQGGVRVEAITPDGVIMSYNGSKFLLPRE